MKLTDKRFWIFEAMMALCAVITLVIVSVIWFGLSGVWWLSSNFYMNFLILFGVSYLIGGAIVLLAHEWTSMRTFSIGIWVAVNFVFTMMLIVTNDIDNSTRGWIVIFMIGHAIVSFVPLFLTCYWGRKIVKL